MLHTLTLELPEPIYQPLARAAAQSGQSLEQWALDRLQKHALSSDQRKAALERLLRHAGAADLGHPTGAGSATIDADLAREYGSGHEAKE